MTIRTAILTTAIVVIASSAAVAKHRNHDEDEDSGKHRDCKEKLTDRGSQWVTEKGAKGAADKSWTQSVRFKWGEEYSDIANARDITYECTKASIGGLFKRCEISAVPCRPEVQRVHEEHHEHEH
jgi:hypothetical protein